MTEQAGDASWGWSPYTPSGSGSVHDLSSAPEPGRPGVVLWVPHGEARQTWRAHYVPLTTPEAPKAPPRRIGFR